MKNKIELKKYLLAIVVVMFLFLGIAGVWHGFEYGSYQSNYNQAVGRLLLKVKEHYPDLKEHELLAIFSGRLEDEKIVEEEVREIFDQYGIDLEKDSVLLKNERNKRIYLLVWILIGLSLTGCVTAVFLIYNRKKDREIEEITKYIEEINRKNYSLKLDSMSEDELSMLKTEIYKTTIMLKEAADNARKDKENLKDTLADISHQMKTPLTSILVILDNLIDEPDMNPDVRQDFILDVKREVGHIQFLVQALLKMTKLDAGTVRFIQKDVSLKEICEEAVRNVEMLCDLKNVEIERNYCRKDTEASMLWENPGKELTEELPFHKEEGIIEDDRIYCDFKWQTEAVTNILKNCVEHAPEGSSVWIETEKNQVYGSIRITDFGPGIEEEDRKHLFERFYRGKNSKKDGVGIGLSLAKSIVEQDKGRIFLDSTERKTVFEVKYFI